MTRFTRFGSIALAVLALSAVAIVAKERPHAFRGEGELNLTTFQFTGKGFATHLGPYSEEGAITSILPLPGGQPWEFIIGGWTTLTAADGDELDESFSGYLNFATGEVTATITFEPTGTGRFANATGTTQARLQLDTNTGSFQVRGSGTIDF
jgi:hypothetical protein